MTDADNRKSRFFLLQLLGKWNKLLKCQVLKRFVITDMNKPGGYKTVQITLSKVTSKVLVAQVRPSPTAKNSMYVHTVCIHSGADPYLCPAPFHVTAAAPATGPEMYWPFQKMLLYHQASLVN